MVTVAATTDLVASDRQWEETVDLAIVMVAAAPDRWWDETVDSVIDRTIQQSHPVIGMCG